MQTQDDPLLKELAGDSVGVTPVDVLVPAPADPLEVKVAAPAPAVSRLNAEHATRSGGKGFAVTIRGDYFALLPDGQGKKTKKDYDNVVVNLPSLDAALSVIKSKLADRAIKMKYPDCVGHRTIEIVSAVPLSPSTNESNNLQYMNFDRLIRYVADHQVPIDVKEYTDVVVLRNTVVDFTLNPEGFGAREAARQADRKITAELAAMNPEIETVPGF